MIPWVAIGGIDAGNIEAVIDAGAPAIAVVRAVCAADDPRAATEQRRRMIDARQRAAAIM